MTKAAQRIQGLVLKPESTREFVDFASENVLVSSGLRERLNWAIALLWNE